MYHRIKITVAMSKSIDEMIVEALADNNIHGIAFLRIDNNMIAIHNIKLQQTLEKRFVNLLYAEHYAITKLCGKGIKQ